MPDFDVAVVGAGPAGSATALWLARAGRRVLLLERSRFDHPRVGESLSPDVNPLLRDLGVTLPGTATPSYGIRSYWGGAASSSHLFSPHGTGWYVDRAAFDRSLASAAVEAGAVLRTGVACVGVTRAAAWELRLAGRGRVRARVLVDATGRAARIGCRLDAERIPFDRLVAVTGFVPAADPPGYGLVETVPAGWWYSAPAGPGQLVVMLLTDADLARSHRLSTVERWRGELGPETAARLGPAAAVSAVGVAGAQGAADGAVGTAGAGLVSGLRVVSAVSQRLHRPHPGADPRRAPWIAVGDAALAVDPITGNGVAGALRSAKAAADTVLALLSGDASEASAAYEAALDRECTTYLHQRLEYYAAEDRWPAAPFWHRRTSPTP
ncbi:FAD-dependent oxidoreductase [Cryptosporangium aurantiacum]|uniref:Dehydrogenase (Flavoprotein) n=1 Tax=Cryptosporangium aurantiacum TaxID=134849 RepID=A0A1M7KUJ6_9ACTN|nr:FAD-dependent oxidoreductase [Cryptosporangium aurantiacum]SHM68716.1 Dehydrogenase (flavoprotein) [Cryptosporangium aurantiacum]